LVKKRGVALLLIVAAGVLGGVASALIVFGKPLGHGIGIPDEGVFVVVWTVVRWVLGLATLSVLFAVFYYYGPNREKPRWTWLSPGGVVATAVWLLASLGFSFYVSSFSSYAKTYGSFTGVVVLLLWLYLSAIAVVIGAELNAELERQGERKRKDGSRRRRRSSGGDRRPRAARTEQPAATAAWEPAPAPAPVPTERPAAPPGSDRSLRDAWRSYGR
jgi:membrane protein